MAELLGAQILFGAMRETTRHGGLRELLEIGTLEHILVIAASFDPFMYMYLSLSLSMYVCMYVL